MIPTKLAAARLRLADQRPYLAAAVWSVHFVAADIPTMACDAQWRMYYSERAISEWPVPHIVTALYHEMCHLLRDHAGRAIAKSVSAADASAWNACADAELNPLIIREGFDFPVTPIVPASLGHADGLLAEVMFDAMDAEQRASHEGGGGDGCDCGSGADGRRRAYEAPSDATCGQVTRAEGEIIRRKVAEDCRRQGAGAGGWQRWADTILTPVVDWRRELGALVRVALGSVSGMSDYSYRRPSRRQSAVPGVVLPSMHQPIPSVGVVVDTSGSMADKDIARALAETEGVLRAVGAGNVAVYACDDHATEAQRVSSSRRVKLTGGGGTDMRVGIEAAVNGGANVVVVVTDGETDWPAQRIGNAKCVAVLVDKPLVSPPAWVRSVRVSK